MTPAQPLGPIIPIEQVEARRRARVEGTITAVTIRPLQRARAFEAQISDSTGSIKAVWLGQRDIPGMVPGRRLLIEGLVTVGPEGRMVRNPRYSLLADSEVD